MIQIPDPAKKTFSQVNRGNILGNLWSTFNIDLQDNLGAVRVGNRMKILGKTGDTNLTNFGIPVAQTAFGGKIFTIGGARVFKSDKLTPDMAFSEDSSTNARTDWVAGSDDLCNFNATLVGLNSTQGKLYSLNAASGGTWTTRSTLAGGGGQLRHFSRFNRLYVSQGSRMQSIDTSYSVSTSGGSYDLSFTNADDGGTVRTFECASDRIWIGMIRGASGGVADNSNPNPWCSVYEWDGISNQYTKQYKIPALGVVAIVIRNDIPIIMDTEGVWREFSGNGFKEIGRLPLRRGESLLVSGNIDFVSGFIHPRGMAVTKDNTILALINNRPYFDSSNTMPYYENLPSGIWECDGVGSAVHKHSLSYMPIASTSVTDHGQNRLSAVGSLAYIKDPSSSAYGINTLFAGGEFYTNASSVNQALWCDAPFPTQLVTNPEGQKYGYFVTPFFQAAEAQDMWKKVWLKYRQFLDSGDKIVLKYRVREPIPLLASITWASTTTFTTSTDLTSYVGYEVEILQGTGGGKCSHIVSVVNNSGTYTVTVDETYTGVGTSTAKARIQNWTKCGSVSDQTSEYKEFSVGKPAMRFQLKVCMQFTGPDEVYEASIINGPQVPLDPKVR